MTHPSATGVPNVAGAKPKRPRRNNIRPFHQRRKIAHDHSDLDSFHSWLANLAKRLKATYGVVVVVPGLTALLGYAMKELGLSTARIDLDATLAGMLIFQSVAIVTLYWLIPDPPADEQARQADGIAKHPAEGDQALEGSAEFTRSWRRAWLWWSILYFTLGAVVIWAIYNNDDIGSTLRSWSPFLAFIDNIETIFIFMCFRALSVPNRDDKSSDIVIGLAVVLLFILAAHFGALHFPAIAWAGKLLGLLSGFAAGLALALLAGRLESKLVGGPLYVTILLYLYAAIQGTFVFLPDDLVVMLLLTSIAFIFKVLLFLFLAWFIESGVAIFYLHELRLVHDSIARKRHQFVAEVEKAEAAAAK